MKIDKNPLPKDIQSILENDIYGGEVVKALGEALYALPRNQVLGTCLIDGNTVDHRYYLYALKTLRNILKPDVIRAKKYIDMPYYSPNFAQQDLIDGDQIK